MRRTLIAVAAATVLAAPATASTADGLRDYVFGRHAWASDEIGRASGYFAGALAGAPDDPVLLRRTFDLALAAGDQALASRTATRLAKAEKFDTTLTLMRLTEAFQRRDWAAADAARAELAKAGFASFALPIMEAWTLAGRSDRAAALAALARGGEEGFAKAYVTEHRAHLLALDGKFADASVAYGELLTGDGGRITRLRLAAASALQANGRRAEARRILDAGGRDPAFEVALARLAADQPIGGAVTDAREGLALLFTRLSADLSREQPVPVALAMARFASFLRPADADIALMITDLLSRGSKYDAALASLDRVSETDVLAPLARAKRAAILAQTERTGESLALLEKATAGPNPGMEDWARLGEAYSGQQRYADAVAAFDKALAALEVEGPQHWYLYFARGSARERAGDWARGEADLREALARAPNEAIVLNYLGYSMLDRGERLAEAQQLIERAVAAKPDDGYIADSLGWAHFRAGRYAEAVRHLERAVALVPGDPTINDHLGDAYWKAGRRIEARFRWKAALDAQPDGDAAKRIAEKLDFGLDVALAASRP
jgi:tetratricopeptide (TPR) repeat protein